MEVKYSKSEPWSFGNEKSLQQNFPKKSLTEIREFLNKNEIYTRFKLTRIINVLINVDFSSLIVLKAEIINAKIIEDRFKQPITKILTNQR